MDEKMKIGRVARSAGVSVDTVRFYERRGVLPPAPRQASGYRLYTFSAVERIRFTRSLQSLGFTLDEIIDMLQAFDRGTATCANQQPRLESVISRIDSKIAALRATRRRAVDVMRACQNGNCSLRGTTPPEKTGRRLSPG